MTYLCEEFDPEANGSPHSDVACIHVVPNCQHHLNIDRNRLESSSVANSTGYYLKDLLEVFAGL